jgi:hypothetical protein
MRQFLALVVLGGVVLALATSPGVALAGDAPEIPRAGDAAALGGIRSCCTKRGTEYLVRGGHRIGLPKGVQAWSPDGRRFVQVLHDGRGSDVLSVIGARGGKRVLAKAKRFRQLTGKYVFNHASWSADSKRLAYWREAPGEEESEFHLAMIAVAGGAETPVPLPADVEWGGPLHWSPTENQLALDGARFAPFEDRFRLEHASWLLTPGAATPPQRLAAGYPAAPAAWSPNGRKLAVERPGGLYVVDVATGTAKLVFPGTFFVPGDWSPDSRRLAITVQSRRIDKEDIRIVNADGTGRRDPTRTPKGSSDFAPVWSPVGRRLAFVRNYSAGLDFRGPVDQQPRFKPPRTFVIPAKGGRLRPLRLLRSGEYIHDWR